MNLLAKKFLATTALALAFPAMAMAELPGPLTNLEGPAFPGRTPPLRDWSDGTGLH